MLSRWFRSFRGLWGQSEGASAMEFALIVPALLLIIGGILDFGHAWYMQQIITSASREGARYGINFATNSDGVRIPPSSRNPSIQSLVLTRFSSSLPSDANPTVTCGNTGYSAANPSGLPLDVTVSAVKKWWMLSSLLGESKTISITTTMNCE